jgi:hypothetical protein
MRHGRCLFVLPLLSLLGCWLIFGCGDDSPTSTTPPPCSIEITSPTADDCIIGGAPGWITWDHEGGGEVRIELFKGASLVRTIYSRTANDGLASWTVNQGGQPTGDDYTIRISGLGDRECTDTSEPLYIVNPDDCEFTLLYPNPTRPPYWAEGDTVTILWESVNTCGWVDINILEGNQVLTSIGPRVPNTGSYTWPVEAYGTGNIFYLFEIRNADLDECRALAGVRIEGVRDCELIVVTPEQHERWEVGSTQPIVWTSDFLGPRQLSLWWAPDGEIPVQLGVIIDGLNDDSPYLWVVHTFGHGPGASFRIQVKESLGTCDGYGERFNIE